VKYYDKGASLSQRLLEGIDTLADNVASTLGPRGRNVILKPKGRNPIVTKDGVTVAEFIDLDDPIKNAGVQILKQASSQTNLVAGDGTTTATVLARAILKESRKYLMAEASPIELKRGIDKAVTVIVENLKDQSKLVSTIDDIEHIATISANGDSNIGKLIATAVDQVGKDGSITVEEAKSLDTSLDLIEGFKFDSGYTAAAFVTDERRSIIKYDDPLLLITDHKVETVEQMLPVLEVAARDGRPFIIIADEVADQALAALIMNSVRGTMKVAAVKAPRYGEERKKILSDLALSVGATFLTREEGTDIRSVTLEHLGTAKTIEISKFGTIVVGGRGNYEKIEERIESLKEEISQSEQANTTDGGAGHLAAQAQERITRLAAGVAIIKVGAATEIEMVEKKHRIEDALEAVRAAQEEGMLPGGGAALVHAVKSLKVEVDNDTQQLGVEIIKSAVKAPISQMALNAGLSPDIVLSLVSKKNKLNFGYDFVNQKMVNMYVAGIIDPLKVTRSALQNAASVASILITTSHAIVED